MKLQNSIQGCLLGTAVGDAIGLPYEGMRPGRVAKLIGNEALRHRFLYGWGKIVDQILRAFETGRVLNALEDQRTAEVKGISGYVYQTVPVAIAAWWIEYGDFQRTVESAIRLGGDTDTVAAIAGGLAGASLGSEGIPEDWVDGIKDWPHGAPRIRQLSNALVSGESKPIPFHWGLALRGLLFTGVVLGHGIRRLFPPY